jgi:hypothetical protein
MTKHKTGTRMTKQFPRIVSLSLLLVSPAAFAQTDASSMPVDDAQPPSGPSDQAPVAQAAPVQPAVTPETSNQESKTAARLEAMEAKLGGLEETLSATGASVNSLKKIKLSGYIQGRYERSAASVNGLKSDGKTPANADRFLIRRARLKTVYEGKNAEYLLQIDATGDGVNVKDAEATFVDTWTPLNIRLTIGQFKLPFGYEILQSSADREMPERSAIVRAYFDGERDRGLRLTARWEYLRLAIAIINGNGVKDTSVYKGTSLYGTQDPNKFKDVVGRIGFDLGSLVSGVSAYFGRGPMATNVDTKTDPVGVTYEYMRRTRLGADLQGYIDVPEVGGLALKGELIWGSEAAIDWNDVSSDPSKNVRKFGWIVTAVQNVGDNIGVVVRVDQFDPNTAKSFIAGGAEIEDDGPARRWTGYRIATPRNGKGTAGGWPAMPL